MWLRVSGWPALRWATAPLLLLGLAMNTVLGPNAMSLSDLGELYLQSPTLRLGFWALWSVAMAPAARAALFAPGLAYLRWLPAPRAFGPLAMGALLACLQAPLSLLLLGSAQPLEALWCLAAAMGAGSFWLAMPYARSAQAIALALLLGESVCVYFGVLPLAAAIGVVLSAWRIPAAWRDAPVRAQARKRRAVVGGSWIALASVIVLHLWRRESPLLMRCALVLFLGVAAIVRFANLNANVDLFVPLLIATTPFLATLSILIALGVQRALGGMRWMTVSMSVSVQRAVFVSMALMLVLCAAIALILTVPTMRWELVAAALAHAIFWGSLASYLASVDSTGSRVAMWFVLIAIVDMLALALLGPTVLIYQGALAILCVTRRTAKPSAELVHA